MDTELLRTFCAVVRTRSFTAAARELGYVQSTVTGHVQALERRLGVRLLDRLPTGAIPTDAGRRLTPLARQVLDLENRIRTEVPADGDEPAGPVHLIAPESVCAYRLPALITRLRAEAPQVRLVLTPGGTAAALAAVRDGTTDVAVVLEPVLAVPDLDVRTVGTEAVVLLAAPAGDRARRWTWADLAERETLLLEEGCSYGDQAARHLVAAGQPADRRTRFGSVEAVKRCTAAGLGWTVLPAVTAAAEVDAGALEVLDGPALPACAVHVATHPDRTRGPAVRLVLERLRALWADPRS